MNEDDIKKAIGSGEDIAFLFYGHDEAGELEGLQKTVVKLAEGLGSLIQSLVSNKIITAEEAFKIVTEAQQ